MTSQVIALNGNVLDLLRVDLVEQIGVLDFRVFPAHAAAFGDDAPKHNQADENKDPEHDRLDGRIHQDSSFPAGENPLTGTSAPPTSSLDASAFREVTESTGLSVKDTSSAPPG